MRSTHRNTQIWSLIVCSFPNSSWIRGFWDFLSSRRGGCGSVLGCKWNWPPRRSTTSSTTRGSCSSTKMLGCTKSSCKKYSKSPSIATSQFPKTSQTRFVSLRQYMAGRTSTKGSCTRCSTILRRRAANHRVVVPYRPVKCWHSSSWIALQNLSETTAYLIIVHYLL